MSPTHHLASVARMVETLLADGDGRARDRILIDAVFELEAAQAVAIWKLLAPEGEGHEAQWQSVLERGPADALPSGGEVLAVLDGDVDRNLPRRAVVLGLEGGRTALVLGEVENPDGRVDLLEALLHLCVVLEDEPREGEGWAPLEPGKG